MKESKIVSIKAYRRIRPGTEKVYVVQNVHRDDASRALASAIAMGHRRVHTTPWKPHVN